MILIILIIILLIITVEIIVIVITITKIKKKEKKSVIRSGAWNNMISLSIILSLYSNVVILRNNQNLTLIKSIGRKAFSGVHE